MPPAPLLVFDTNILMDVWLGRDGDRATLLLELAEQKRIEVVVPEYVLLEFQGTARRWLRGERIRLNQQIRPAAKEWERCKALDGAADQIRQAAKLVSANMDDLEGNVSKVAERIRQIARTPVHSPDVHFRGDLRFLSGLPPDRPVDGIKDCRIYEAVLEVAKIEAGKAREKILVTKDKDFDYPVLIAQLAEFGFAFESDLGKMYGQYRDLPPIV